MHKTAEEIRLQQIAIDQLRQQLEEKTDQWVQVTAETERLQVELAECEAARDDFFDDADRYAKLIKQLEKQALTPEQCDRILNALKAGQQSQLYRRVAAILVEIYGKLWR